MIKEITILSKQRYEMIDITDKLEEIIKKASIKNGLALIFVRHSTAGVILTENEAGLKQDWINFFKRMMSGIDFKHNQIDNNADSHILAGLMGQGRTISIENNKLNRGFWQQIFLAEFDGPRTRTIIIKII
ncbi:YjbQ family protein [Patescibacteria group bacterium]|nr:YjbQ family protein [Patescibacteria group bacterium]